ncbi:hypothetical protein [Yoonia sediminilitoris]|uniref:DUF8173 domain-containing protein n=1 Tax=Yoonia sediminilitoris TaxID=1286148 RepID=A0A2T6KIS7_9RHOB|nr:hypothetical protein [Yoonia sediminilitoris]PUB15626.1 hypothetical protein C8N45_104246 [Yoonia sediminilitoris]RCW96235.1 hypothetical protein DFP92_104245 [Yoonia sediminilitoris]
MRQLLMCVIVGLATALGPASAQEMSRTHGGDTFIAAESVTKNLSAPGDVFAAGSAITTSGSASGDIHIAGFDLDISTQVGGNLYAAGSSITIGAPVAQDVTAAGFSLRSTADAITDGNLRFFGRNLTIEGPVAGALTAMGGNIHLNAPVQGEAWIVAESVTYGPQARIDGNLILSVEDGKPVPVRVLPAERITLEDWDRDEVFAELERNWDRVEMPGLPIWMSLFSAFLITTIFLLLVAAVFLTFAPKRVERLRVRVTAQPLQTFLLGVIGLSALFGVVPVAALTLIGIPFIPFALLLIVVAWTLGYLLAAYAVARRILVAFGGAPDPSVGVRLLAVAGALVAVAILNFIPFVGWVINYTLVLLGVGAITAWLLSSFIPDPDPALELNMRDKAPD